MIARVAQYPADGSGTVKFVPGLDYNLEGRVVRLVKMDGLECEVLDVLNQNVVATKVDRLAAIPKIKLVKGVLSPALVKTFEWKRAKEIEKVIKAARAMSRHERTEEALDKLAEPVGIKHRQLQRLWHRLDITGTLTAIVRGKRGPKFGSRRLDPKREAIVGEELREADKATEAITLDSVMEKIKKRCEALGLKPPSEKPVIARAETWGVGIDFGRRRRLGPSKAKEHEKPNSGKYRGPFRPLMEIQIDHTRIDLMAVDAKERVSLGRPWLTLVIDSYSRVILGFYLSYDAPSIHSVALALLCAVMPKYQLLKELGLEHLDWSVWGKPKKIFTDRAREFRCNAFLRGCRNNHIKVKLRPLGKKHWGGIIERAIGTLMGKMHLLVGTTFNNPKLRDRYDSEARATMDLTEIRKWIVTQIVAYNHTSHSTLKRTPMQQWKHGLTTAEGVYVPPAIVDDPKRFRMEFLPTVKRTLQPEGFHWEERWYKDGVVSVFNIGDRTHLYYDPDKPRMVHVRDRNGNFYDVRTFDLDRDLSSSEIRRIHSRLRAGARNSESLAQRHAAKEAGTSVEAEARMKTRRARRRRKAQGDAVVPAQAVQGSSKAPLPTGTGEFVAPPRVYVSRILK